MPATKAPVTARAPAAAKATPAKATPAKTVVVTKTAAAPPAADPPKAAAATSSAVAAVRQPPVQTSAAKAAPVQTSAAKAAPVRATAAAATTAAAPPQAKMPQTLAAAKPSPAVSEAAKSAHQVAIQAAQMTAAARRSATSVTSTPGAAAAAAAASAAITNHPALASAMATMASVNPAAAQSLAAMRASHSSNPLMAMALARRDAMMRSQRPGAPSDQGPISSAQAIMDARGMGGANAARAPANSPFASTQPPPPAEAFANPMALFPGAMLSASAVMARYGGMAMPPATSVKIEEVKGDDAIAETKGDGKASAARSAEVVQSVSSRIDNVNTVTGADDDVPSTVAEAAAPNSSKTAPAQVKGAGGVKVAQAAADHSTADDSLTDEVDRMLQGDEEVISAAIDAVNDSFESADGDGEPADAEGEPADAADEPADAANETDESNDKDANEEEAAADTRAPGRGCGRHAHRRPAQRVADRPKPEAAFFYGVAPSLKFAAWI